MLNHNRTTQRCPCCRYLTLTRLGSFECCPVCYWEDDGQSNVDADDVRGGPNGLLSLTEARKNYHLVGACDPEYIKFVRKPYANELGSLHPERYSTSSRNPSVVLLQSFPNSLAPSVVMMANKLQPPHTFSSSLFFATIGAEEITIPYRNYHNEPISDSSMSDIERQILYCIYTRSHDGHLREEYLRKLLKTTPRVWTCPYVLQLLGEYVMEILLVLQQNQSVLRNEIYQIFALQNSNFVEQTKYRIISYWNEYYRRQYPDFRDYPGYQIAETLGWWNAKDIPKLRSQ